MIPLLTKWTDDSALEEAKKHTSRTEWSKNSSSYSYAQKKGSVDKFCSHMSINNNHSLAEKNITNWLQSLNITEIKSLRIGKKSLDIYLPQLNLAVEYNGLYWHAEELLAVRLFERPFSSLSITEKSKVRNYHLDKTLLAKENGIRLIHIWEHEWITSKDKVKSYLRAQLGLVTNIYARNCSLIEVSQKVGSKFIQDNHLMGSGILCTRYIGLEVLGQLVACVGFRKVFNNYELYRAAYLSDIRVVGGLSKILSHFIKSSSVTDIVSYIDLDKFEGEEKEQMEVIVNFQYHFSDNELYKNRHLKRFNFLHKLLKEKKTTTFIWDVMNFTTSNRFEKIIDSTDGKIEDYHFSFNGNRDFANMVYDRIKNPNLL
jgi:hypothetical protein